VNGAQVASRSLTGSAANSAAALGIGSRGASSEFFNGTIDEAAVYRAALTPARVAAHRSAGAGPGTVAAAKRARKRLRLRGGRARDRLDGKARRGRR
jgi:hypothetical protein